MRGDDLSSALTATTMTSTPDPTSAPATPSRHSASPTPGDAPNGQQEQSDSSPTPTSDAEASGSPQPEVTPTASGTSPQAGVAASAGDWQAIWSPAHNAYYFFNSTTQETTWTNPLQQESAAETSKSPSAEPEHLASTSTSVPPALAQIYELQAAAAAQGIDPSLAFLDPSLAAGPSTAPAGYSSIAKFNARTGAFARPDARDPTHLSEYERMKRMNEVFFDTDKWEEDLEKGKDEEAEGKKRKKPTKKDLVSLLLSSLIRSLFTCLKIGEVQGPETTEENRKDCMAAHLEHYDTNI